MRRCAKCSLTFDDSARICRSCGAILDHLLDDPSVAVEVSSEATNEDNNEYAGPEADAGGPNWACPKCGETVPDTFAFCWNCNGERPGVVDSETTAEPESKLNRVREPIHSARCAACGSTKIVPNATIVDQGQYSSGSLCVVVAGDPYAILFKDRLYGALTADICGECGHVNVCVRNPGELYEHYLKSRQ